jgi:hypothetical protein
MSRSCSLIKQCALFSVVAVPLALLGGCALTSSGPTDTAMGAFSGVVHGGQSPIQGSTVNLYVTPNAATGYGQAATLIGTSSTDASGAFTISPSATSSNCPAGQQAYITAAGGYPSGSPALANNSVLLMAALGDCANVSASTYVIVNEVTTVAAGYALSGFMTTSANGSLFQANVSAPAANNAATGTMSAAAGLPHAFLNAASLANYATGAANTQTANITVGATTVNGSVPANEINTLGVILQGCVNATTGNALCSSLFSFTPSISGVAPTNTLQSMINLARNPYPSAAAMDASTGLFSLVTGISAAFQPVLSAAPPDWSLAIVYKGTPLVGPYDLTIDANDTVYQGASASATIWGLSPYGVATPAFTAGTGTATRQLAADSLGNVWVTNNGAFVYQYSAGSGGAPTTTTWTSGLADSYGVAVDKAGGVWFADATTANASNIYGLAYSAGNYAPAYTATAPGGFEPVELTIDANQNIWSSDYYTQGTMAAVLPNLSAANSSATPTYTSSGTVVTPISAVFANSAAAPLGVVIDAGGNAWYGITYVSGAHNTPTTTGLEEVVPTLSSSVITGLTPQSLIANATLGAKASQIPGIDGAGSIYLPDNQGTGALGIHVYSTVAVTSSDTGGQVLSPPSGYLGCYLSPSTVTACGAGTSSAVYNPREIAIDSTGSVWAGVTSGGLTQLIGLAAPSWPLLQTGKPSLSPGNATVTPLP